MDPLHFLEPEELLRFFHCRKTSLSCMEKPHTFLSQLRDHNLIPEDRYQKVSRMKSKEHQKKAVYDLLDWLERERSQNIHVFWKCVFEETMMNQYATLRLLRNSLMDGSFHFHVKLPEKVEKEETNNNSNNRKEDEEEKQPNSVKRKRNQSNPSVCGGDDEEQPGPSSQLTPGQKRKSKKICFSSPLKKGEKGEIWTWAIFKSQLPVTCGDLEGTLNRERLARGEKCILFNKRWFTPGEFEKRAGKESLRNWKMSIRCKDTPLGKLIQEGHLKTRKYVGGCQKAKKFLFPSNQAVSIEEESKNEECEDREAQPSSDNTESSKDGTEEDDDVEEVEETLQQQEVDSDRSTMVFRVTCGALAGTLHKKRFASGTCGKSIRTETSWMSPVEFVKEASGQTDASWKRDITCGGKPLSVLIEEKVLRIHSLLCCCSLCRADQEEVENQKNDDECYVCKSDEGAELVVCDRCPLSFHQECHLPRVEDDILRDNTTWMCTFCIFKESRQWCYRDELGTRAAMSQQISQHMLECQYLLLYLYSADEEQTFALDPTLYLKNYSTVIKHPMWFGKIADRLQKKEYHTVGEFVSDVQLIFTNCSTYNRGNAEFLASGNQLKELFDDEFKKVFNIS